jgi:hypothetical protein
MGLSKGVEDGLIQLYGRFRGRAQKDRALQALGSPWPPLALSYAHESAVYSVMPNVERFVVV